MESSLISNFMIPVRVTHLSNLQQCDEVFALYRGDSGTLGFMPRGAFEEGIQNRRLLVASDDTGRLIGYLLYRIVGSRASIAHVCVAKQARGKGVAINLVSALKEHTADLDGITLKCRNDFEAHRFWPKLGFIAKGTATGRGANRAELTIWHIDHGHPDLFSVEPTKTRVVIDANVFFDLWAPDRPMNAISASLIEPWVDDIIELVLTPEIYNDIQRAGSSEERNRSKSMATTFEQVRVAALEVDRIVPQLRKLYPTSALLNQRDESDIRHLAFTITAKVKYFVTRDEGLLDKSSEVLQQFDVQIFSPTELVSHLDWIAREQAYQPLRLEGSTITSQRAEAKMLNELVDAFRDSPVERLVDFRKGLEKCFVDPRGQEVRFSRANNGEALAMLVIKACLNGEIVLTWIRQSKQELAPTVIRHLLMSVVRESVENCTQLIRIDDTNISPDVVSAIKEIGFRFVSGAWLKPVLSGFVTREGIGQFLSHLKIDSSFLADKNTDEIETFIWPAKLDEEGVPCYLIPIRAEWAEHFFDTELAEQRLPGLCGIREELHLGVEAAYYSASNISICAPGRILWYVSQGNEKLGSMQVKACSRLREVVRSGPKPLFKRFRRLGVYDWKDLFELAGKSVEKDITAFRFSHTERFHNPLDAKTLASIGVPPPYPGPRPISHSTFISIYKQAQALKS